MNHPLVQHHLGRLRDVATGAEEFRSLVRRIATLLAGPVTADLETQAATARTPLMIAQTREISQRIALVPILRAGLGMVDPLLELIPMAEVWHLGVFRNETTAEPVEYYQKLPATNPVDVAIVLDPMLATGGSAILSLNILRRWGVPKTKLVSLLAAPEGIAAVRAEFPETDIFVAAIDERLNDRKFIVPGLGDAGDRQFRTEKT